MFFQKTLGSLLRPHGVAARRTVADPINIANGFHVQAQTVLLLEGNSVY
jgi:hypothetical protein